MEFDWLYLNPWHYPGFQRKPLRGQGLPPAEPHLSPRRRGPSVAGAAALRPAPDPADGDEAGDGPGGQPHRQGLAAHPAAPRLVRVGERPGEEPVRGGSGRPAKATVWGDLAEIDNLTHHDREGLWRYWAQLVREAMELGFKGFRCDAAYKVPAELWSFLIREAKSIDSRRRLLRRDAGGAGRGRGRAQVRRVRLLLQQQQVVEPQRAVGAGPAREVRPHRPLHRLSGIARHAADGGGERRARGGAAPALRLRRRVHRPG